MVGGASKLNHSSYTNKLIREQDLADYNEISLQKLSTDKNENFHHIKTSTR